MLLIDEHTNANQYNTRASQEDIENIINAGDLVSEHIFRGAKKILKHSEKCHSKH